MGLSKESEEILQALFSLEEEGSCQTPAADLLARAKARREALDEAAAAGLVHEDGEGFALSDDGRADAAILARRHRLAERLLQDVLQIAGEATETTACEFEHFLQAEVADSICTLLGHPRFCPHGKPIPPGECCEAGRRSVAPAVEALSELRSGESGTVAYVRTASHERLDRVAAFGLVPGTRVRVHQTWPSFVVLIGETQLGLDRETAADIFVRRVAADEEAGPTRRPGRRRRWRRRGG
jgi:DtxR family Mn-dependent transcriptional regulator